MKTKLKFWVATVGMLVVMMIQSGNLRAQVNPGSDGSDGALDFSSVTNPTNVVIDLHDHPNGVYQYTAVNITSNVTVTFIQNTRNTPVYWLVQSNVVIAGVVNLSGVNGSSTGAGGAGGPGGYAGGNGSNYQLPATGGQGPDGGNPNGGSAVYDYANQFLVPLLGGSGGGGIFGGYGVGNGGGGGGGAMVIAASNSITVNGSIYANGGVPGGSGGGIRLVAPQISGTGQIAANGSSISGAGAVRFDAYDASGYTGSVRGNFYSGSQFVVIPADGQIPTLCVQSVGGAPVAATPQGLLAIPDVIVSATQTNPLPVVVTCTNLPLNSTVTVVVKPANASPVSAVGSNTAGSDAASTATILMNIPRGGGLIYATGSTSN